MNFEIDAEGSVRGISTLDRPRAVGNSIVETPWSGIFGAYRTFSGVRVPTQGEVTWHLAEARLRAGVRRESSFVC